MKQLLWITAFLALGLGQNSFAEDRSVQETVQSTRNEDGTSNEYQDKTTTSTSSEDRDSRISKGGFYIEPLIFASQEDSSIKTSQLPLVNNDTSGKSRGYGVGLRFGGHVSEILLLGLDARYAKMKMSDSTAFNDVNADVYNVAPMIGLQTPLWGVRLTADYVVAGENNPDSGTQGLDLKFKEAQGWRFGAGLHVASIGINLEYQDLTYNKTEVQSLGAFAINNVTGIDAETKGYSLSLSFPVEL